MKVRIPNTRVNLASGERFDTIVEGGERWEVYHGTDVRVRPPQSSAPRDGLDKASGPGDSPAE